jgi:hypothetical protein
VSDFYLESVEQLPQVVAGETQFFSQAEGRTTGNLAIGGRRPDSGFDVFLRHGYLYNKSGLEKIAHEKGKIKGMIRSCPVDKTPEARRS